MSAFIAFNADYFELPAHAGQRQLTGLIPSSFLSPTAPCNLFENKERLKP
jgi:hypothetical protein